MALIRVQLHPRLVRWRAFARNLQIDGFNALPIIGLTSFLIGVVVAYQGADQLKNYGANIFVVDLVGYGMQGNTLLIGIGKSFVFATVIAMIGCFQGFRTHGGADSVGRQTTRSVVQSIFIVIVADALFPVAFNLLGL